MADATATNVEKAVVTTKIVKVVTLTLTEEEALTLLTVTNFIGGDPNKSRRRHFDEIGKALRSVLGYQYDPSDLNALKRSIWFNDEVKAQ